MNPLRLLPGLRASLLSVSGILLLTTGCHTQPGAASTQALRDALLLHASFDHGVDADLAVGARGLSNAPSLKERDLARAGLPADGTIRIAENQGVFGHALQFTQRESPLVFFSAERNAGYRTNDWNGTVSFWLRVDPELTLAPGYCDPIQITPRTWNDAAFFVEFEKRTNDVPFRLGIYPDLAVWNPSNRRWEDMAPAEKPLLTVAHGPFSADQWTHVAFTFAHFNTGRDDGVARLYLNGIPVGEISPRRQTFTWEEARSLIMLGIGYIGLWDELAIFNRTLSPEEVGTVYRLRNGIADLQR